MRIFFQQPTERFFFIFWAKLTKEIFFNKENVKKNFRVKLTERPGLTCGINIIFPQKPIAQIFFPATLQTNFFFRFAPRPPR